MVSTTQMLANTYLCIMWYFARYLAASLLWSALSSSPLNASVLDDCPYWNWPTWLRYDTSVLIFFCLVRRSSDDFDDSITIANFLADWEDGAIRARTDFGWYNIFHGSHELWLGNGPAPNVVRVFCMCNLTRTNRFLERIFGSYQNSALSIGMTYVSTGRALSLLIDRRLFDILLILTIGRWTNFIMIQELIIPQCHYLCVCARRLEVRAR